MLQHDERLKEVDPRLCSVIRAVVLDCVVITGARDKISQDLAVAEGRSKTPWPTSKHNVNPPERVYSEAVDLCPVPIDWSNAFLFRVLAGAVLQEAKKQGIPVRWGGCWDGDLTHLDPKQFPENTWDAGHFELIPTQEEA
jgi:peptidoglycan LD-endopeptidase CwlK